MGQEPHPTTAYRISSCFEEIGDYDKALEYCNQAIDMDSTETKYIYFKANILDNSGKSADAIKVMSDYIALNPEEFSAYYRRGWFKDHSGDTEGALEDYTISITLEPEYAYSYLNRGVLYRLKGDKNAADEDFKQVIKLDSIPEEAECSFYAYYYLGHKEKAIEIMNKVLEKDSIGNYYDAACLYSIMGETEKSISYLRKALESGFRRFAHIRRDRDLNNIRSLKE